MFSILFYCTHPAQSLLDISAYTPSNWANGVITSAPSQRKIPLRIWMEPVRSYCIQRERVRSNARSRAAVGERGGDYMHTSARSSDADASGFRSRRAMFISFPPTQRLCLLRSPMTRSQDQRINLQHSLKQLLDSTDPFSLSQSNA